MNQDEENGLSPFLFRASVTLWQFKLVRQVRIELTIPCLRGRCLDPIWLLTQVICDFQLPISNWFVCWRG
jgi:hypothetical protein